MTYSTLKKISVASVAATMFIGTAVSSDEKLPKKNPFDLSKPCPPALGLGFTCEASAKDPCIILPEFNLIGVDDQGRNNSQFFKMDLTVPEHHIRFLEPLGGLYPRYDIEALDSLNPTKYPNSESSCLFAASGDDDGGNPECDTGCLYNLNKSDGSLTLLGDICTQDGKDLKEVDAIAFRPDNDDEGLEKIWGWSRQDGLFKIETPVAESNLCGDKLKDVEARMICDISDLVVEDMTWVDKGWVDKGVDKEGVFYAYVLNEKAIYKFDPDACENYEKVCTTKHEIEALEYIEYTSPENGAVVDLLVLGYHNNAPNALRKPVAESSIAAAIALNNPRDSQGNCNLFPTRFQTDMDIEGLAYP